MGKRQRKRRKTAEDAIRRESPVIHWFEVELKKLQRQADALEEAIALTREVAQARGQEDITLGELQATPEGHAISARLDELANEVHEARR